FFVVYQQFNSNYTSLFNEFTKIFLFYFACLNILKIYYNRGSFTYIKKIFFDLCAVVVSFIFYNDLIVFQVYIVLRQIIILIDMLASTKSAVNLFSRFRNHPSKVILLSFGLIILLGTTFLSLPLASSNGESIGPINAGFTATSATCVTGLIVLDTGTDFSPFGHAIILILMQIGGLGIMTFSTALIMLFGKQIGLQGQSLLQGVLGEANKASMMKLLRAILITTFTFELIGAMVLFLKFRPLAHFVPLSNFDLLGHCMFHSVSAFCNAGFCLYPDSFMRFQGSWSVNLVITSLIIAGGIGFTVLLDVYNNIIRRRHIRFLSLHSKIVIVTTIALIVIGSILIFAFEYNNQLNQLPMKNSILASTFQSVTTRTAGFNTLDISKMSFASVILMIVFMFIGASPGSTGGGIKTTSFAILILSVWSIIRHREDVEVFNCSVSSENTKKVMSLITISGTILVTLILVLCVSEANRGFNFEQIVFEAFSAFGTVGLSMGITPHLTSIGKLAIIALMYLGRVGPLTIAFALSEKKLSVHYHYPDENIAIG
ncbi:MAG: potassium transporter Trk, partial [Candidatus Cloacimonetes bacterium]|nr:potassium transporter Trk [Candidatus Cloacimonadota bacterium]